MKKLIKNWLYLQSTYKYYQISNLKGFRNIDVFGPAGVGKSTFINALIKEKLIQKITTRVDLSCSKSAPHSVLLKYACDLSEDLDVLKRKANKLHFDLNISNHDKNFLIDEGISQSYTVELVKLAHEFPSYFEKICEKRAVINLSAPSEIITERIYKRFQSSGKLLKYHENKSQDELIQYNELMLKRRLELCEMFQKFNVPVLTLNATENMNSIVDKTRIFIDGLK